jgi:hypothetical protein
VFFGGLEKAFLDFLEGNFLVVIEVNVPHSVLVRIIALCLENILPILFPVPYPLGRSVSVFVDDLSHLVLFRYVL